ncbi:hypothetical protein GGI20_005941 [Coemansia sp. BCRC 34301]|nr:hypothetical protein GGI20_005941 [Coemansia sp. BCRC 34301]
MYFPHWFKLCAGYRTVCVRALRTKHSSDSMPKLRKADSASSQTAAPVYVVYRVDTNGVEHTMSGIYQTYDEAQLTADRYEQLGHKNGYFIRQLAGR